MSVVVIGSINADLAVSTARHPTPGETLLGTGGNISPGGKGANQAVAAALQGSHVSFLGAVGSDAYAPVALSLLEKSGVNLSRIQHHPGPTGLAVITVAADGENTIIVVPGANAEVSPDYIRDNRDIISRADIVVMQGELPSATLEATLLGERGHPHKNSHPRFVINLAPVIPLDRRLLLRADPLILNEYEAQLLLNPGSIPQSDPDIDRLIQQLLGQGFSSLVMTLGARGVEVVDHKHRTHIPAPPITPIDTTGAGDAFVGGLVARLDQGDDLVRAAKYAVRIGAFACTRLGAQRSYPHQDDILPF
ncbi:ribokinase [Corynebacterium sp. ES2794-CONJ1]|uniref:ribokinase n=1 Tax=unclassified Corynebacterium TaxID=2624378 RepID=UPI00216A06DF|nr:MULTISPECIES: ribokinase [unclassified Corynebacterium]MCS4489511.1 ribokinase [Corynebacterium sp. ES2775-CONJ]MCS4491478.1 ribokinase [Corynebacterium sp. ES2715-CONJ3]MCU9518809.1 ribokinase [Corynebacterium sp. ES2794-CONJ1]